MIVAVRERFERPHLGWCVALLAAVIAAHAFPFYAYHPGDADGFVIPWYRHIVQAGRIHAFAHPFSNYTPPYLYLLSAASLLDGWLEPLTVIKLLSCAGAAWIAFALARLLLVMRTPHPVEAGLASLLLPSIVLNVSVLGQADTFWVAPCIFAVRSAIQDRRLSVAVWSGVALAFKAQAIFLAPFVLLVFFMRKAPWWCWALPAVVYLVAMLPAWLLGWPAWHLLTVYLRQAQWQPGGGRIFISNGASWWTIYGHFFPQAALKTFWIGYLAAAVATAAYIWMLSKRELSQQQLLAAAALSAAGLPFLLPGMHERFFILADVLTFCLAVADPKPRTIAAAVLMQLASSVPGYGWALGLTRLKLSGCFFCIGALILLVEYLAGHTARSLRDPESKRLAAAR